MADKPKCSVCNERDAFAKGKCSRCYSRDWWRQKQAEKATATEVVPEQKLLTAGNETVIEGEIVHEDKPDASEPTATVHLVARNPAEMQAAQADLKASLSAKLSAAENEVKDMNAAISEAKRYNWKYEALTRARNKAVALETFYFKLLAAVDAGYVIIPDFPVEVFAIRVVRPNVRAESRSQTGTYSWPHVDNERPDTAPAGAGEYKNPSQMVRHIETKEGEKTTRWTQPADWQDEIAFPMIAARPLVMNATQQAMALKVFDQLGVCLPVQRTATGRGITSWGKGDPLIIGQILLNRNNYTPKCVSFIIAWHLNLNDL